MAKILVVEDDKFLASAFRAKLTKSGFDIELAADGQEAIDALKHFDANLILLDLVMPRKDGFVTLNEIKRDPKNNTIPVIVTSNLGQKEDMDKAMALGAVDYIIKSDLSMDALVDKINSILQPPTT